jgi:Penicillin-binding Protein dimerisation domain
VGARAGLRTTFSHSRTDKVCVSYWFRNDNRLPQARLAIVSYIIVGMIGVLLLGFWKLQVIDSDKYGQMAEQNRVRSIPIIAPRGRMLDRDGRVLVDNRPSFSVLLLRDDGKPVEPYLPAISDGLGISIEDLRDQLQNTRNLPKFQPIVIKPEASSADLDFIESHRLDIPVLEMLSDTCQTAFWHTPPATSGRPAKRKSKIATGSCVPATWLASSALNVSTTTS